MDTRFYDSHNYESIFNSYLFNKLTPFTNISVSKLIIYGHTFL